MKLRSDEPGQLRKVVPGCSYMFFPYERLLFSQVKSILMSNDLFMIIETNHRGNHRSWKILSRLGIGYVIADSPTVQNSELI